VNTALWIVAVLSALLTNCPCIRCSKPSKMPVTSIPLLLASIVAEWMTPLIPGAGPPPTRIASLRRLGACSINLLLLRAHHRER